jgi:hypothetical protein
MPGRIERPRKPTPIQTINLPHFLAKLPYFYVENAVKIGVMAKASQRNMERNQQKMISAPKQATAPTAPLMSIISSSKETLKCWACWEPETDSKHNPLVRVCRGCKVRPIPCDVCANTHLTNIMNLTYDVQVKKGFYFSDGCSRGYTSKCDVLILF